MDCTVNLALKLFLLLLSTASFGQENIILEAKKSILDRESNSANFEQIRIAREPLVVTADLAQVNNLDFNQTLWTLSGNINLENEFGSLVADSGQINFTNYEFSNAIFFGTPSRFDLLQSEQETFGEANRIELNLDDRNIRFFNDAIIQVNNTQFRGCDLIFDLNTNRVTAGYSECGENIQITIVVE